MFLHFIQHKKLSFFILFLFCYFGKGELYAQVKIGNNPTLLSPAAVLELESSDKGLLIPRIALSSESLAAPVTAPDTGLLVFNTNPALSNGSGFYYWTGSSWSSLASGGTSGVWSQNGNHVYYTSGNVGIGTSSPQAALDIQSTQSGLLLPRMTETQRMAIAQPQPGMIVFNTSSGCFEHYVGPNSGWRSVACDCDPSLPVAQVVQASVCVGDSIFLSAPGALGAVQWQVSSNNVAFQDINNATQSNLSLSSPGAGTWYYRVRSQLPTCSERIGNSATVTVTPLPNPAIQGGPFIIVAGQLQTFSALTPALSSYQWTFTGANPPSASGASVSATWASTGSYPIQLAVTNAQGCSDSSQTTVTVTNLPRPTNIALWLAADSLVTLSGQQVSQWNDLSGNNRHAVQSNLGLAPTYATSVQNGLPAVRFNGSQEMVLPSFNMPGPMSMFFVYRLSAGQLTGHHGIISDNSSFSTRFHFYLRDEVNAQLAISAGNVGFRHGNALIGGQVASYTYTGSTESIWLNGALQGSSSKSGTFSGTNQLLLGRAPGAMSPTTFNGDLLEVLIYNVDLTTQERTTVEQYLQSKYAIP